MQQLGNHLVTKKDTVKSKLI